MAYINKVLNILWIRFYRGLMFGVRFCMIYKGYVSNIVCVMDYRCYEC
jgi:hypothetical protein